MIDPYTAAAAWQLTNRTDAARRETDEVAGRMVAAVHRLLRGSARALRRRPEQGPVRRTTITEGHFG